MLLLGEESEQPDWKQKDRDDDLPGMEVVAPVTDDGQRVWLLEPAALREPAREVVSIAILGRARKQRAKSGTDITTS